MPIRKIANVIVETPTLDDDQFIKTGVIRKDGFAICDSVDKVKQLVFDPGPSLTNTTVTLATATGGGTVTITLPATGSVSNASFKTIQVDHGTNPQATSPTDALTLTSADGSVVTTGNSSTNTVDLKVGAVVKVNQIKGATDGFVWASYDNAGDVSFGALSGTYSSAKFTFSQTGAYGTGIFNIPNSNPSYAPGISLIDASNDDVNGGGFPKIILPFGSMDLGDFNGFASDQAGGVGFFVGFQNAPLALQVHADSSVTTTNNTLDNGSGGVTVQSLSVINGSSLDNGNIYTDGTGTMGLNIIYIAESFQAGGGQISSDAGDLTMNGTLAANVVTATTSINGTTLNLSAAQTTINGSVSGTAKWSMPQQGSSYKLFFIRFIAYHGTGGTVTFPTAFTTTPTVRGDATVTSISTANTTTFTIATTGASSLTGNIFVEGY